MRPDFEMVFRAKGQMVDVTKPSGETKKIQAAYNAKEKHFTFRTKDEIDANDIITDSIGTKYVITSVEPMVVDNTVCAKYANVITEKAYNEQNASRSDTYNIGTVVGSNVGSQTNATVTNYNTVEDLRNLVDTDPRAQDDKEDLQDLIDAVNTLIEADKPVRKSALASFSGVLQKHSWIASPIAALLLRYFTGV